ncbi:MAG: acetamidase/formamidase family protein, partial [Burkholderiales bacterium]|nr:acetamidase/formamidase family protein [Burkholderiales bacterium]
MAPALFGAWGRVPLKPFAGTERYLPVEVSGTLFSVGDTHAAQGDGEACGTAIESPMRLALQFDLVKNRPQAFPRFVTPGPVTRHLDAQGYEATMGIGPELMQAASAAVRGMVELLAWRRGAAAPLRPGRAAPRPGRAAAR